MEFNQIDLSEIENRKETDRLNFMRNIHFTNEISLETVMRQYFDQVIGMYDIYIQSIHNIAVGNNIDMSVINSNDIKFSIICESIEDAILKKDHLSIYTYINVYDKIFYIRTNRKDNVINIVISYHDV